MKVWLYRFVMCLVCIMSMGVTAQARNIPVMNGYVNDTAGIMSVPERNALEDKLSSYYNRTSAQIAVLTVPSLEGESLFDFAQKTARKWKIGSRGKDNGVLIVFSVAEQGRRVHVGARLDGSIPDAEAVRIITELMDPQFRKKKHAAGFEAAIDRIDQIVSGGAVVPERETAQKMTDRELAKFALFLVAFVLLVIAHSIHWLAGGVVGCASFAGVAWLLTLTQPTIITAAVFGLIVGLLLRWLTDFPWCGGGCGDMAGSVAGAGGEFLGAGAEILGGL